MTWCCRTLQAALVYVERMASATMEGIQFADEEIQHLEDVRRLIDEETKAKNRVIKSINVVSCCQILLSRWEAGELTHAASSRKIDKAYGLLQDKENISTPNKTNTKMVTTKKKKFTSPLYMPKFHPSKRQERGWNPFEKDLEDIGALISSARQFLDEMSSFDLKLDLTPILQQ